MIQVHPIETIDSETQFFNLDELRNSILVGHVLDALKRIPDESVDMICTSPPYYGVRNYKTRSVFFPRNDFFSSFTGQLGHEKTPQEYIYHLIIIFQECFRVLKRTGSLWIVIADSYWGGGQSQGHTSESRNFGKTEGKGYVSQPVARGNHSTVKNKSLIGIPERLKVFLIDEGFLCRSDIIWFKPNPTPESAKDRFTRDYEHILFFTKQGKYFFKQQLEPNQVSDDSNWKNWSKNHNHGIGGKKYKESEVSQSIEYQELNFHYRNKRTIWRIPVRPYEKAHFATFNPELIQGPLDAGCPIYICKYCKKARETTYDFEEGELPEDYQGQAIKDYKNANAQNPSNTKRRILESMRNINPKIILSDCECGKGWDRGIVLDPFMGSGTTGKVAKDQGKDFIGIELQEEYVPLMKERIGLLHKRLDTFFK